MDKAFPDGAAQVLMYPLPLPLRGTGKAPRFAIRCLRRGDAAGRLPRTSHSTARFRAGEWQVSVWPEG